MPSERIDCYGTGIYLTTRRASTSSIMIYIGILNTGALEPKMDISCGREIATSSTTDTPKIPQPNTNQLLLQDKSGWCLLERNIGIVQMADTSGHAWTLK